MKGEKTRIQLKSAIFWEDLFSNISLANSKEEYLAMNALPLIFDINALKCHMCMIVSR